MPNSSLKELVQELFDATDQADRTLEELKSDAERIKLKMDPRVQFNQWRNSREGREWKKKQYQEQQQSCAICKEAISLRNAQVDHIKPIADYPELSTEPSNLRLTCQHCNLTRPKKPTFSS